MERYTFVRLLGKGAAGAVYLVEDKLLGGRRIALKRINAGVDVLLKAAFEREFATMASLSLAGVARVFDFGIAEADGDQPGGPFYTRSFIDGSPLDLAALSLAPLDRIRLVAQVADIIAPLHRVGVVHGDIKPGNIIVDPQGQPYVIDFGLARFFTHGGRTGSTGGTPAFMAPELLRGDASSVHADIYALGVTLWTVLLGIGPFEGSGRSAVRAKLEGTLPTLPVDCDPVTSAALKVALRALAYHPLDRFPTVEELRVSLDQVAPSGSERVVLRGFVPPRPRGHEAVLAALEAQVNRITQAESGSAASDALVVVSPSGGGKTSLLRELKWRLQIRAFQVFEISANPGDTVAPLLSLMQQALIVANTDQATVNAPAEPAAKSPLNLSLPAGPILVEGVTDGGPRQAPPLGTLPDQGLARAAQRLLKEIRHGRLESTPTADMLASLFARASSHGPVVVLIDDLDNAEGVVGEILRSAIHAEMGRSVAVVATASHPEAPALKALRPSEQVELPRLGRPEVAALTSDALGTVDASVVEALYEHSQGLAASLIDALSAFAGRPAPTAAEVLALPVGQAGLSIARSRLLAAPTESGALLATLAVIGASLPVALVREASAALDGAADRAAQVVSACEDAGLIVRGPEGVALADRALLKALLEDLGADKVRSTASKLLTYEPLAQRLTPTIRARLAVVSENTELVQQLVPQAARELIAVGGYTTAIELCLALVERAQGDLACESVVSLAQLYQTTGDHEAATRFTDRILKDPDATPLQRIDAVLVAAQAFRALSRFDQAIAALSSIADVSDGSTKARLQKEIAQVHLRRGDYDAMATAATAGLSCAPPDDLVRIDLLTALGLVASYRGHHEAARIHYQEALSLARRVGSKRDQANALSCLAVGHQRASEYAAAGELFAQSLAIARELGDIGSMATFSLNSGAMRFMLGEPARAVEHYEAAIKLARRAGRVSTHALARNNLALLYIYFGLYERARSELAEVLREAQTAGLKYVAAQATGALGDLAARTGDVDGALRQYDEAIARYLEIGQAREVAEAHLDAADALLDREGPADISVAAARLAEARGHIEREKLDDFKLRLELLLARALSASGDSQGAIAKLETVLKTARGSNDREIEWKALAAAALAHESQGADFMARRYDRKAVEVLEQIALNIPQEHRQAFWFDVRRREVRRRAGLAGDSTRINAQGSDAETALGIDARSRRLLEITKRLASEHDLDRLLERITESAVDLSGAERGLVLLVSSSGKLETKIVSYADSDKPDSHVAFSRSIAEAVLIDGEPIVSMDAADDRRLSEYLSVHQLMLRSIACLPIQGHSGPVGVLYLEHRRRRGRFRESDMELLLAFADQAALALENARLIAENTHKCEELERVNADLSKARQDMEDLLIARTEALDEAKRELERVRQDSSDKYFRHGMVGRNAKMQRLFDTIDRVRNVAVPVVVQGESGTGKELVARAIHYGGPHAKAPFVTLNCASIPETLLESELFGHVRGAFTGAERSRIGLIARASGGTLLLDEIGDMSAKMQVELLRVIQEGVVRPVGGDEETPVTIRFIATSSIPLAKLVSLGRFREDLYYRLGVVEIELAPLRERRDDIPLLCDFFLQKLAKRYEQSAKRLSAQAMAHLCTRPWPGNVRQLEHAILNAWVMAAGNTIEVEDLSLESSSTTHTSRVGDQEASALRRRSNAPRVLRTGSQLSPDNGNSAYNESEKNRILQVLESNGGNKVKAAQVLGMARRTLYRRLLQYGIGYPSEEK